jgi:hypothetical protein
VIGNHLETDTPGRHRGRLPAARAGRAGLVRRPGGGRPGPRGVPARARPRPVGGQLPAA